LLYLVPRGRRRGEQAQAILQLAPFSMGARNLVLGR
jgi:hypothetical protein